jgi:hypothetical protein
MSSALLVLSGTTTKRASSPFSSAGPAKPAQSTSTDGTVTRKGGGAPGPPPDLAMVPSIMMYSWLE